MSGRTSGTQLRAVEAIRHDAPYYEAEQQGDTTGQVERDCQDGAACEGLIINFRKLNRGHDRL